MPSKRKAAAAVDDEDGEEEEKSNPEEMDDEACNGEEQAGDCDNPELQVEADAVGTGESVVN